VAAAAAAGLHLRPIITPAPHCSRYLDAENAEDDEERAADEDDVADRSQRRQQRLNDQLQTRRTADYPAHTNNYTM